MFTRKKNPAVPLPWRADRKPPKGFTRPPTTAELIAQRAAAQTPRWVDDTADGPPIEAPSTSSSPWAGVGVSNGRFEARDDQALPGEEFDDRDRDENWPDTASTDSGAGGGGGPALAMFMGRATDLVFGRHRIAVIGDVGGVASCFDHVLGRLGVIGDVLPVGLTVVQLGDLIGGQGHDSALLDRVDRLMTANPGSWVQLAGNWESRHLPGFVRFDPRKERVALNATDVELLGSWWRDGHLRIATAIDTPSGEMLITHAGLTAGLWRTIGQPASAVGAAEMLNEMATYVPELIGAPGEMMHAVVNGQVVSQRRLAAGPLWASASELWSSWAAEPLMPFHQVVGHTAPWYFNRGHWSPHLNGIDPVLLERSIPDAASRHVLHTHPSGHIIRSIDCGLHSKAPAHLLRPLQVDAARVL